MNGRARPSSPAASKAYPPSFSYPPSLPPHHSTSTFGHNTILIRSFNSLRPIELMFTCAELSFGRAPSHLFTKNHPHTAHRALLAPYTEPRHKAPKHTSPSSAWLQIVHWMHWVSEARVAARATAGRRPPPPRTNRSLPGGGRFMKWGRWQGEGRRRDCQGASSPLPALHSSQVLPPWRERWWGCCSSGGALYLGCTAAEWTQLHNGPHTSDSPLLVHPVSSDSQLIPTSTSGRIAKSVNFRSQDPSQKVLELKKKYRKAVR